MNDIDAELRTIFRAIHRAPIPPCPVLPTRSPAWSFPWSGVAAALLLGFLLLVSRPNPIPPATPASKPLAARIAEVEARIATVEPTELRALLQREIELLRRELALAQASSP